MKDYNRSSPITQSLGEKKQPISLIAQLMQEMGNMQHVDDVLRWLATSMVYHLNIPVVQIWAVQRVTNGQSHLEPRATASQNTPLLNYLSLNQQISFIIYRLLQEQRASVSLPVEQFFTGEQTPLLFQYGWRYWSCSFLQDRTLLPPARGTETRYVPAPLLLAVTFFLQTPFPEKQERAIGFLFEQALRLLYERNFLMTAGQPSGQPPAPPTLPFTFADLIPHRSQDVEIAQASNPFATATMLTDKKARQLYTIIDGQKTLVELARHLAFNEQEIRQALRYLLQQGKVVVYTRDAQAVDASFFGNA